MTRQTKKISATQLAGEVHAGKWGEGEDLTKRLVEAGHDADFILKLVEAGIGKRHVPDTVVAPSPTPPKVDENPRN